MASFQPFLWCRFLYYPTADGCVSWCSLLVPPRARRGPRDPPLAARSRTELDVKANRRGARDPLPLYLSLPFLLLLISSLTHAPLSSTQRALPVWFNRGRRRQHIKTSRTCSLFLVWSMLACVTLSQLCLPPAVARYRNPFNVCICGSVCIYLLHFYF